MAVNRPDPLSFTHSLAYIYLFMAHHGDAEGVTTDELQKVVEKVREWNDQFAPNAALSMQLTLREVNDTARYFAELTLEEEKQELALHLLSLRKFLPERRHKEAVVRDLVAIAEADGKVTGSEKAFVALVYQGLGLG